MVTFRMLVIARGALNPISILPPGPGYPGGILLEPAKALLNSIQAVGLLGCC